MVMSHTAGRKATWGMVGGLGLSLIMGFGYPKVSPVLGPLLGPLLGENSTQSLAQAQIPQAEAMTLARLEAILQEEATAVEGDRGQWQLTLGDRPVIVLADAANNRMRIVAPIASASELSAEQVQSMLLANFHTALDARYALSNDTVVSVFVHPLSSLDESYLRSALSQVVTAADTFGTSYSSGEIGFGPNEQSTPARGPSGESLSI
ncbi:MAG: type III secretion system chaperone [Cyanobacteria bacterium J06598_3]